MCITPPSGPSYFNPRSPRGERQVATYRPSERRDFNPRSPRGERRNNRTAFEVVAEFQSTLPARGATGVLEEGGVSQIFQSTLPARGATMPWPVWSPTPPQFQSTLPARGATARCCVTSNTVTISIHAPREGSDNVLLRPYGHGHGISIHAPREGSDQVT